MFDKLTDNAREVMALAGQKAKKHNNPYIGTEHILLGLIQVGGITATIFWDSHIELKDVRSETEKRVPPGSILFHIGLLSYTPQMENVFNYAKEEAKNLKHNYLGVEHLFLGLLREKDGVAYRVLSKFGVRLENVRKEVQNLSKKRSKIYGIICSKCGQTLS